MEISSLVSSLKVSLPYTIILFLLHYGSSYIVKSLNLKDKKRNPECMNRICSTVHASIQFAYTVYYWLTLNTIIDFNRDNKKISDYEIGCHDYMMGYLIYDIVIELLGSRSILNLSHHIIGFASHMSVRMTDSHAGRFYSMLVFIAEGSTPWLHISWIMHQIEKKSMLLYYICVFNTIVTFFIFRVLLSPYIFLHLNWYKSEWNNDEYSTNFIEMLYFANWLVILFFFMLNYYWFFQLMKMVLGSLGTKKSKKNE